MHKFPVCSFLGNSQTASSSVDSPLQLKLINYLGLKKYMMDNFIFKRKPSSKKFMIQSTSLAKKTESTHSLPKLSFNPLRDILMKRKSYKPKIIAYLFSG